MDLVEIHDLDKYYGVKQVLKRVSLQVPEGVIFALLGPNGAGKTTLIKAIFNFTTVDAGTIKIIGEDWRSYKCHRHLSYFPEKFYFFPYYKVKDVLQFYGQMHELSKEEIEQKTAFAIGVCGLDSFYHSRLTHLSKGQWQRVGIGCALMSNAKLYILDEPFSGLDPIGVKEIRDVFFQLKAEGKTVFINSHILSEVEKFVDYVAIIDQGVILTQGPLKDIVGNKNLEEVFFQLVKGNHA
jgi:ABC-2 type transport system ATP-binding protein